MDRSKLDSPEPRHVFRNLEKYSTPYAVAITIAMLLASFLVHWGAVLAMASFASMWVYRQYVIKRPMSRDYSTMGLLMLHMVAVGFLGGTMVIFVVAITFSFCVVHASCRRPSKLDAMARITESSTVSLEALETGTAGIHQKASGDELDQFRKHSQSLKAKYGLAD